MRPVPGSLRVLHAGRTNSPRISAISNSTAVPPHTRRRGISCTGLTTALVVLVNSSSWFLCYYGLCNIRCFHNGNTLSPTFN